ncbi:MAG: tRNA pseudouridine(55) synthase TruB [Candidatus Kapaibacteriales bacterium]
MTILTNENIDDLKEWLAEAKNDSAILLIDKPKDWTSFDIIAKVRNLTKIKKIGHTGTLDPFATGLLILLFNKATKLQNNFINLDKSYVAKLKLGAKTRTYDVTSPEEEIVPINGLTENDIRETILSFIGKYNQSPPIFSAKKIGGIRLYKLARRNEAFNLTIPTQLVKIYSIMILNISLPFVTIEVNCSKGTYVRSLANDIGIRLGIGAYLFELRRTKIGNYFVNNALNFFELISLLKSENIG